MIVHDQHIQGLPALPVLRAGKKLLLQIVVGLQGGQGDQALVGAGEVAHAGNAAQQTFGGVAVVQRIVDVDQILGKGVELIGKGEPDQHTAVGNAALVEYLPAMSAAAQFAHSQGSAVAVFALGLGINVDHTALETAASAVVKVEVKLRCLEEGTLLRVVRQGVSSKYFAQSRMLSTVCPVSFL